MLFRQDSPARAQTNYLCLECRLKACRGCKSLKPLAEFPKCKTVKDGRKSRCLVCTAAESKAWRAANPDKARAAVLSWRERNPEQYQQKKREADRLYRLATADKRRARREETAPERAEALAAWKRANRETVRDYERRRRAAIRGSKVEEIDLEAVWDAAHGVCELCGSALTRDHNWPHPQFASLDHITPLARGGHHVQNNVRYVHLVCNMRKNDSLDSELTSTVLP